MINLLPVSEKNRLRNEYRLRVVAYSLLMMSFVGVIALVTLVPSVYFVLAHESVAETEQAIASEAVDQSTLDELKVQVELFNKDIGELSSRQAEHLTIEHVVSQLVSERTSSIDIDQIFYAVREGIVHIELRGIASDRDSLSEFSQLLEANPFFHKVDVPVENYIESDNIEYGIILQVVEKVSS